MLVRHGLCKAYISTVLHHLNYRLSCTRGGPLFCMPGWKSTCPASPAYSLLGCLQVKTDLEIKDRDAYRGLEVYM